MTTALETLNNGLFCTETHPFMSPSIPTANVDNTSEFVLVATITDNVTADTFPVCNYFPTTSPTNSPFGQLLKSSCIPHAEATR